MTDKPSSLRAPTPKPAETPDMPISQGPVRRKHWPAWAKQLPSLRLPPPKPGFSLIDRIKMRQILEGVPDAAIREIEKDMDLLDTDLIPFFNTRDYEAAHQQNRYRLYQIGYIVLATCATIIGTLLVLALQQSPPRWVPFLAFLETVIALLATFLASLSGQGELPLSAWLKNRNRAENLRREYFRFLVDLPPYDALEGYQREMLLAKRAALINQGNVPEEEPAEQRGGA